MWQALNTLYLELDTRRPRARRCEPGPTRSTRTCASAARSGGAWPTRRCSATGLRLPLRRPPRRGREHDAADAARLDRARSSASDPAERRRRRAALLQAIGGLEAFRRSVPGPADAYPVAALPALRAELPALGRRPALELLHARLRDADPSYRTAPPLLRLARLRAELEFHRGRGDGSEPGERPCARCSSTSSDELAEADVEIEQRYFGGAGAAAARGGRMRFQITYTAEYEYSEPVRDNLNVLRVQAGDDAAPDASTTSTSRSTRRRACTSTATTSAPR